MKFIAKKYFETNKGSFKKGEKVPADIAKRYFRDVEEVTTDKETKEVTTDKETKEVTTDKETKEVSETPKTKKSKKSQEDKIVEESEELLTEMSSDVSVEQTEEN